MKCRFPLCDNVQPIALILLLVAALLIVLVFLPSWLLLAFAGVCILLGLGSVFFFK